MQEHWAKIVAGVLSPIIVGLSGAFALWCADNLPGTPQIDADALAGVFAAGALAAGAALYKYLANRGLWEIAEAERHEVPPADVPR